MPSMTRTTSAAFALAATALLVSGCSQLGDVAQNQATSHADTRADMQSPPNWLPADATDITSVSGTAGGDDTPTTATFTSKAGVTDSSCESTPRHSAPTMSVEGGPDPYKAETVLRCGPWSMTSRGDHWVAWTPNTGDAEPGAEATQTTDATSGS